MPNGQNCLYQGASVLDTFLIFIGAGLGGVFRFWVSNLTYFLLGREFPYGTLIVNISGCFLMGFLFILLVERVDAISPELRAFLLIGLLGGYTTFSSFSIETFNLLESGAIVSGIMNVILSVVLCIVATWLGVLGGRFL